MKKANIERQLKAESELIVPDPYENIIAAAQAEGISPEAKPSPSRRTEKTRSKKTVGVFASIAATAACLAIVLPVALSGKGGEAPRTLHFSAEETYGLGAVTAAKLLDENITAKSLSFAAPFSKIQSFKEENRNAKAQAQNFNRYFTAFDCFMGETVVSADAVENTDEAYPFAIKMTVGGKDFNGNTVSYTMYYTETPVKEENDGKETETEYLLEGVMLLRDTEYYLTGERTFEAEKGESENELKIRAYADKNDKSNYIEMEQEISEENKNNKTESETEYVYSVYENGKLVEKTAVEFEIKRKDGKEETSFVLEFLSGGAKGKYEAKREVKNGVVEFEVEYEIDGEKGEFRIRKPADGNGKRYEYLFPDNDSFLL